MGIVSTCLFAFVLFAGAVTSAFGQVQKVIVPESTGYGYVHLQYNPSLVPNHTHFGVDIIAGCGKSIFPLATGRVVLVKKNTNGLGNAVMLRHSGLARNGGDLYTIYLHMQTAPNINGKELAPGDDVYKGVAIGKIGDTGFAEGCHTHFEIRNFYFSDVADGWFHPQSKRCSDGLLNIYACGDQRAASWALNDWEDPQAFQLSRLPCNPSKERCTLRINGPIGWYPPVDDCQQASQWFELIRDTSNKVSKIVPTTKSACPLACYAN